MSNNALALAGVLIAAAQLALMIVALEYRRR
jgi:hypothetical protein